MLHIVHLLQRRHPAHARRIVLLLGALSACALAMGIGIALSRS